MPGILADPYETAFGAPDQPDPTAQDVGFTVPGANIPGGNGVRSPNGMPGLYQGGGGAAPEQPQEEDTGLLGKKPSQAAMLGLLSAGLGILANNTGHYGQAGPAIGRGGLIGIQTFLGAKQQEDVHNAMTQRVAQQQQAGKYQAALRQAYVVKPDTGEVDRAATRRNLGALDPRLAMQFDREQAKHDVDMITASRKGEVANSLIAERRSKILGGANEGALKHYFGLLQQGKDPVQATKGAQVYHAALIDDARKNMLLPADFKPQQFDVESGLRSLNEDGSSPALMNDEGQAVNTSGEPQDGGMTPVAAQGEPGMMNVGKAPPPPDHFQYPWAAPGAPNASGGVNWGEAYALARLYKRNPATDLMLVHPRTGQPIRNEPLIAEKLALAKASKSEFHINAAGGDVVMPGTAAKNELDKDIIGASNGLARLQSIQQSFKPEYLEMPNQLAMKGLDYANKLGLPISDEQKTKLTEFSRFRQDSYDHMNRYIKEITGAAMSEVEATRLRKAMPDPENDGPAVFKAKIDHSMEIIQAAGERYQQLRTQGLSVKQAQVESKKVLLDGLAPLTKQVPQNPSPPVPRAQQAPATAAPKPMTVTPQGQPRATKRYNPVTGKFEVIQ